MSMAFQKFRIGSFGEEVAEELLREHNYLEVRSARRGQPGWDIEAISPRNERLAISVKTRNKRTNRGELNKAYHLFKSAGVRSAVVDFAAVNGLEFRWLTVQVDVKAQTVTAHIGTLAELDLVRTQNVKFGIPMTDSGAAIGILLAKDRFDIRIRQDMSNVDK